MGQGSKLKRFMSDKCFKDCLCHLGQFISADVSSSVKSYHYFGFNQLWRENRDRDIMIISWDLLLNRQKVFGWKLHPGSILHRTGLQMTSPKTSVQHQNIPRKQRDGGQLYLDQWSICITLEYSSISVHSSYNHSHIWPVCLFLCSWPVRIPQVFYLLTSAVWKQWFISR